MHWIKTFKILSEKKKQTLNSCWLHLYSFFCNILWAGTFSWQQIYSYRIHLDKSLISSAYLIQIICWIIFELLAESIRCFCLISQITILDWRRSPFVTVCYISLVLRVQRMTHYREKNWSISLDLHLPSMCQSTGFMIHSKRHTSSTTESLVIHVQTSNPFLILFHCRSWEFVQLNHKLCGK